jgi:DNA-binding transcriptional LysR family regulator
LFARQARGVAVTEDARILYPQARRILSQTDSMTHQFRHGSSASRIEIGVEADIAGPDIAAFMRAAQEVVPGLFVNLLEGCQGDARLATEDERCEDELFLPLSVDPYVLALPAGSGADAALPWIVCPSHPTHQRLLPFYGAGANTPAARPAWRSGRWKDWRCRGASDFAMRCNRWTSRWWQRWWSGSGILRSGPGIQHRETFQRHR